MRRARADAAIEWLMAGDASIRWQTLRDLTGAADASVTKERAKVARDGWGARLLDSRHPSGTWAVGQSGDDGLYTPKWTSTTKGKTYFDLERLGKASRWNTLRALRVLKWWDAAA